MRDGALSLDQTFRIQNWIRSVRLESSDPYVSPLPSSFPVPDFRLVCLISLGRQRTTERGEGRRDGEGRPRDQPNNLMIPGRTTPPPMQPPRRRLRRRPPAQRCGGSADVFGFWKTCPRRRDSCASGSPAAAHVMEAEHVPFIFVLHTATHTTGRIWHLELQNSTMQCIANAESLFRRDALRGDDAS